MFLRITAPCGKILGETPINAAIALCDGSYGLIEYLNDDLDRASKIENAIIDNIRDQCEPISEDDFDPKPGMRAEFEGFAGEIIND
jgi:hypothetical protein